MIEMTQTSNIKHIFETQKDKIDEWLEEKKPKELPPIYASVDIRDAGFKAAIVDKNLFPAGFNNLCEKSQVISSQKFKSLLSHYHPNAQHIGLIAENHTRNPYYLANIQTLKHILELAGYTVQVRMDIQNEQDITLETTPQTLHIYPLTESKKMDILLLNNDLSNGIPTKLDTKDTIIFPSPEAGWHKRRKSRHFAIANPIIKEFAEHIDCDPWLISCLFSVSHQMDIHSPQNREELADLTADLLRQIQQKYTEHHIQEKPYVFVKSDNGTYGMGIQTIDDPNQLLQLNRKTRNKLDKGKHAIKITQYLIQEGIPSASTLHNATSETCVYQVGNDYIGSFLRINTEKSNRDNLNAKGMRFAKICYDPIEKICPTCEIDTHPEIHTYITLAKLSGIAAAKEIEELENQS